MTTTPTTPQTVPVIGLQCAYASAFSTTPLPAAFAYPAQVIYDNMGFCAGIAADIYNSVADFEAGEQPVGQHSTQVTRAAYLAEATQAVTSAMVGQSLQTLNAQIWLALMMQTPDTPTGQANPDGSPVLGPFYSNATIVSATKTL